MLSYVFVLSSHPLGFIVLSPFGAGNRDSYGSTGGGEGAPRASPAPPGGSDAEVNQICTLHSIAFGVNQRCTVQGLGGRDTRQEDVEGLPAQSRISPSIQRILRYSSCAVSFVACGDLPGIYFEYLAC